MAAMNISLPNPMKDWVNARTADGRYVNASDYVRDLIRKDKERNEKMAHMQRPVDEGLASSISTNSMNNILAKVKSRHEASKNS